MEHTILLFLIFLIEAVIMWLYTSNLFIPTHSSRIRLILLCVFYIILFLFSLFKQTWLNIAAYFIINAIFLCTQFKLKFRLGIFHSAIVTAIMGISELTVLGIISKFAPYFIADTGNGLIFYTIFSKFLFFAIICLLGHLFKEKNTRQVQSDPADFILLIIPILSIFIMFTFLTIGENVSFVSPLNIMVTFSAVCLLTINLLIFGIKQYNQKKNMELMDMQLLLQRESDSAKYYEMLLSQNENQRILIHDIKKHLQSIELLNAKNESDKITAYIHQLMDSSNLKETSRMCDNEFLNSILCRYQRQFMDKHISFHADIRSDVFQNISPDALTSLFCNLLDNALESAVGIPESFVEITVQQKENTSFIIIVMINSCSSNPSYDENGLPVSRKLDSYRHGFGMKSIKKVVKQCQGNLQMYYDDSTGTFHTIITLKQ